MSFAPRTLLAPALLLACLVFGGASAEGYMANMLLQLAGIATIAWSLVAARPLPPARAGRPLIAMLVAMLLIVGVQLVPLPPGIWTALPGHDEAEAGYALLGLDLPWLPISMTPDNGIASILWTLPAMAVLLATLRAGAYRAEWLAGAIIAATLAAIALGAVQRSGNMAAYIYRSTNVGLGTGFFANANHMATLLVCSIPFASALYLANRAQSRSQQHSSALKVMLVGALVVLLVGIAVNGSLAGLGLAVPALGASMLMLLGRDRRIPPWALVPLLLFSGVAIALMFTQPLGNDLTSAGADLSISRRTFFANTLHAAGAFAPLGSGLGSFPEVYPLFENHDIVVSTFVNHAHSDLLELLLETGVPGMLLLAAFLVWWLMRAIAVWRAKEADPYAQAATIASAAILGHSLVDYPLRTAAISALFAACLALMAGARPWVKPERSRGARHLSAD